MTQLPASIEQHLQDSGFSATEILILKKLLNGESVTLRELAAKTGKSTGVLDQATKKLLEKNILKKDIINDTPKYALVSLTAIQEWVEEDVLKQHAALKRKKENFDAFLSTVKHQKGRPEMEYFEGTDGMEKAFEKLLALGKKEWLHFQPAVQKEEEDPIAPYRVQLFRRRRNSKVFLRALTPNTPLGKRYRSRDVFEYRETQLTDPASFPVNFEQYIVGDTIACIDTKELKASFIHYPELAEGQRKLFEVLWCSAKKASGKKCTEGEGNVVHEASIETAALSGLREFFLSKKSVVTLAFFGVLAGVMTWGMYVNNQRLNVERVRQQVLAVATTGAKLFAAEDVNALRSEEDINNPAYERVVKTLDTIRKDNLHLKYVYIIRPTDTPNVFEFAADSYGLDLDKNIDFNQDGILGPEDEIPVPGMEYDVSGIPGAKVGLQQPFADDAPFTDQWGTFISGFAPIRDSEGNAVAVLGIDRVAGDVQDITLESFEPLYWFICIFALFVLVRFFAFHRPLAKDLWELSKNKKVLTTLTVLLGISLLVTAGMYRYTLEIMKEEIGNRLMSIAATAAPEINASDLEPLHIAEDMKLPEYQRVYEKLNEIRDSNNNIKYVYIMRPAKSGTSVWEFVADADTTINTMDGEDASPTGFKYDLMPYSPELFMHGLNRSTYENDFIHDQWGVNFSGASPIVDNHGRGVAILGIDMDVTDVYGAHRKKFSPFVWFGGIFSFLVFLRLLSIFLLYKSK